MDVSTYSRTAGHYISIQHGDVADQSINTRYLHLSKRLVRTGTSVRAGQVIGKCGSTGQSTGPHLHFEVIIDGKTTPPLRVRLEQDQTTCEQLPYFADEYPTSVLHEPIGEHSRL